MLAAAMSSSLNALASTTLTDFYQPLVAKDRSESHYMKVSRMLTAFWGAVQIAAALYMIGKEKRIVDMVLEIASFTNGPILGLFFLGTLTRRVGRKGALACVVSGIVVITLVAGTNLIRDYMREPRIVSWQWYVLIGSMVTFVVGYTVSLALERAPAAEMSNLKSEISNVKSKI